MVSVVPVLEGIPSLCIELLFLLLTGRVLVEYVREMQRTRSDDGFGDGHGDIIAILRDHVLHFSCYLILSVMQVATISANVSIVPVDTSTNYHSMIHEQQGDTDGSRYTRGYFSQLDYVSDRVTDLDAMAFAYNPNVNT
ncbi:hypothetical protein EV424DRAFT_1537763 [Suillus variegatus]|nr:hypothetical protein EV424DRAFT_1537763 [Suillus variegatus]